jgi:hypothetical protein
MDAPRRETIALKIHETLRFAEATPSSAAFGVLVQHGKDASSIEDHGFPHSRMYPITAANSANAHTRNNSQVTDSLRATSSADVFSFSVLLWWLATGGVVDQDPGFISVPDTWRGGHGRTTTAGHYRRPTAPRSYRRLLAARPLSDGEEDSA